MILPSFVTTDNIAAFIVGAELLRGFATFIVNKTDTPYDDKGVKMFYRFLEVAAGIITPRAKK